jgi:tripartite-type tricarboxylate transporter receptor subunit TctC
MQASGDTRSPSMLQRAAGGHNQDGVCNGRALECRDPCFPRDEDANANRFPLGGNRDRRSRGERYAEAVRWFENTIGKTTRSISMKRIAALLAAGAVVISGSAGAAESYPARPLRLVVPFAPGGGTDVTARYVGTKLAERVGQPVIVDNRPAASGVVGADLVAKAAPDGYTLLVVSVTFVISSALQKGLPYTPADFAPITLLIASPLGLLLHPSVPAANVKELIAYAKANPGKLNYGSSGAGSIAHLSTELLDSMAGIRMTHVPYKGVAAYTTAQLQNEIQVGMSNMFSTLPQWKSGRLRLIAHAGAKRMEALPDVPTIAESGVPGYEAIIWYGFMAPGKTPQAIVQKLYREIAGIAQTTEARKLFVSQGNDVVANTPEEFAKVIRSEAKKWGDIGRRLGVSLE